jgi:hypothetical protein
MDWDGRDHILESKRLVGGRHDYPKIIAAGTNLFKRIRKRPSIPHTICVQSRAAADLCGTA